MSVLVRRGRVSVGTCSAKSGYCRDVIGDVGLVSGLVRQGRASVVICTAWSILCRELFDDVG